jgi:two-component system cell cycle sensor histidine kinase/response regulator CckA
MPSRSVASGRVVLVAAILGAATGAASALSFADAGFAVNPVLVGVDLIALTGLIIMAMLRRPGVTRWQLALTQVQRASTSPTPAANRASATGPTAGATGPADAVADGGVGVALDRRPSALDRQAEAVRWFVGVETAALLFVGDDGETRASAVAGGQATHRGPGTNIAMSAQDALLGGRPASAAPRMALTADLRPGHPLRGDGNGAVAVCPLSGSPTGIIAVFSSSPTGLAPRHFRRLRQVSRVAATDVARASLDDAERRSRLAASHARRHLALLVGASLALSRGLDDWGPSLEALVAEVVPRHADFFAVDLIVADGSIRRVASAHADPALSAVGQHPTHPQWEQSVTRVMDGGTPAVVPDLRPSGPWPSTPPPADSEGIPAAADGTGAGDHRSAEDMTRARPDAPSASDQEALCAGLGLSSWAVVPITIRGLPVGALTVGTIEPRRGLRPSDVDAYEELASRTAVTLERVLLYQKTQDSAEAAENNASRLGRAIEAAPAITASLTLPDVAQQAARQAARIMGAARALVLVHRLAGGDITASWPHPASLSPIDIESPEPDEPDELTEVAGAVREGGRVVRGEGNEPWIAAPIMAPGSQARGTLVVRGVRGHVFGPNEESVLVLLAQVTAAAIGHAELYEAASGNERRLQAVVDASPLAILELDPLGTVVAWNAATAALLAWDPEETRPGPLHPDAVAILVGCGPRLHDGEAIVDERLTLPRHDGSTVEIALAAALLGDGATSRPGEGQAMLYVISDVSERQLLEREIQQTRRMEALGRLAGGVAHDFNNLLTVIVGYSDLLANELGEHHPLFADVNAIRGAGQRASTFTEQLLTISRRRVVRAAAVDVNAAVQELASVLRRLIGEHIDLRTDLDPGAGRILIDGGQLDQVILNLVVNARDAMPSGGQLTITTAHAPGEAGAPGAAANLGQATLTVRDTGVGMDATTIEHCFEPFFTIGGRGKATGLGLATVYGIVREAGGTISIDSVLGAGTSFDVSFPRIAGSLPEPVPSDDTPIGTGQPELLPDVGTILLVEDEPHVRAYTEAVLAAAGFTVRAAAGADEATALMQSLTGPLDLLVTDVVMPGTGGPELAARLAAVQPGLPVLFVSGYVEDSARERLDHRPTSRFLSKPFRPAELLAEVRGLLADASTLDHGSNR